MPKSRSAVKPSRKPRRKPAALELSPDEVVHLEQISKRYEESERAWLRMTAPPDGDEGWSLVEEHLLARGAQDADRRWKYFSK
jgi:hypothetical protein